MTAQGRVGISSYRGLLILRICSQRKAIGPSFWERREAAAPACLWQQCPSTQGEARASRTLPHVRTCTRGAPNAAFSQSCSSSSSSSALHSAAALSTLGHAPPASRDSSHHLCPVRSHSSDGTRMNIPQPGSLGRSACVRLRASAVAAASPPSTSGSTSPRTGTPGPCRPTSSAPSPASVRNDAGSGGHALRVEDMLCLSLGPVTLAGVLGVPVGLEGGDGAAVSRAARRLDKAHSGPASTPCANRWMACPLLCMRAAHLAHAGLTPQRGVWS